jgi:hypothetical protein
MNVADNSLKAADTDGPPCPVSVGKPLVHARLHPVSHRPAIHEIPILERMGYA